MTRSMLGIHHFCSAALVPSSESSSSVMGWAFLKLWFSQFLQQESNLSHKHCSLRTSLSVVRSSSELGESVELCQVSQQLIKATSQKWKGDAVNHLLQCNEQEFKAGGQLLLLPFPLWKYTLAQSRGDQCSWWRSSKHKRLQFCGSWGWGSGKGWGVEKYWVLFPLPSPLLPLQGSLSRVRHLKRTSAQDLRWRDLGRKVPLS